MVEYIIKGQRIIAESLQGALNKYYEMMSK